MRHVITGLVIFISLLIPQSIHAQETNKSTEFAQAQKVYQDQLFQIEVTSTDKIKAILVDYAKGLDVLEEKAINKGDLKGVMAIKQEKADFKAANGIPNPTDQTPAELKTIKEKFKLLITAAGVDKKNHITKLTNLYIARLEKLQILLTKAKKIDEALAVKAEITKVAPADEKQPAAEPSKVAATEEKKPAVEPDNKTAGPVTASATTVCRRCNGVGTLPGFSFQTCQSCTGRRSCQACNATGKKGETTGFKTAPSKTVKRMGERACTTCSGTGQCRDCGGRGHSEKPRTCYGCNGTGRVLPFEPWGARPPETSTRIDPSSPSPARVHTLPGTSVRSTEKPVTLAPKEELQFTDLKKITEGLRTSFSGGKAREAEFNNAVANTDANKGVLLKSRVYLFEASPRQINIGSTKDDKFTGGVGVRPDSHEIGQKAVKLFWELKRDDMVTVTYGIVGKDNITYFDVQK